MEVSLRLSQQRQKYAKTLGVYIHETLTFDYKVDKVCRAGFYKLAALRGMRNYLSENLKIMLVNAIFFPRLTNASRYMAI